MNVPKVWAIFMVLIDRPLSCVWTGDLDSFFGSLLNEEDGYVEK